MLFNIRRRSTGELVKNQNNDRANAEFPTRESAKPTRDKLNDDFYSLKKRPMPIHNREYYVVRSHFHRFGPSK